MEAEQVLVQSNMVRPPGVTSVTETAAPSTYGVSLPSKINSSRLTREAELALIARCQAGDREAFGVLLNRYQDRVINLAYQLLQQRESAEDVAQEAFTQAFTAIGSFRGESQMFTWLYRITVNLCLQRRRRTKLWEPLETQPLEAQGLEERCSENGPVNEHGNNAPYTGEVADKAITKLMVEQTLAGLSEPLRVVLILREMHDLSYEEVATVLHIPVGTVRSRLNEARRKFRDAWYQAEQSEMGREA